MSIYDERLTYPLQEIFSYLSCIDLFHLSNVSWKIYYYIEHFSEVNCLKLFLEKKLFQFFNRPPLLTKDDSIRMKLKKKNYTYKWLFTMWCKYKRVHRIPVRSVWFAHAGQPEYVPIYYDRAIKRYIIEIKSLIWLDLTYRFANVTQGHYRATLRMEVNNVSLARHNAPGRIKIYWQDTNGYHENHAEVKWHHWSNLRDSLKRSKFVKLKGAVLTNYDNETGWFDFCLQDFELTSTVDVYFAFNDVGLKSGMRWDYLELKPTNWSTIE